MKKIFGWVALLMGMVTGANAQVNDTIQRAAGNDLYQGITRKLPYRQMVTPHGVQVIGLGGSVRYQAKARDPMTFHALLSAMEAWKREAAAIVAEE
jgi:hypothetical protein